MLLFWVNSTFAKKQALFGNCELGLMLQKNGSNYGYAWTDAIQIKESACHSNGVGLVV